MSWLRTSFVAFAMCAAIGLPPARGQALSLDVEAVLVPDVGASWVTVDLVNTYTASVVACTYNLRTNANNEATVRVRNAGTDTFEVRAQRFENSDAVTASDIHCLIADEGVNTLSDGRVIEARTVLSTVTAGSAVGWATANTTNVTAAITGGHSNLVILGQVMTFNDPKASVFWTNNCNNRGTPAILTRICVGKHIGMITGTRLNETLGYIVTESGTGTVNDVDYAFARGPNSIRGTGNAPPYQYTISGDFDIGVASNAAENGGNGGWAVLYGNDPLPNNRINLAVEEETVEGDTSRGHIDEEMYYGVFKNNQTADLDVSKSAEVWSGSPTPYAVPGSDILYTLNIDSVGTAPVDTDTVFLVDTLPPQTEIFGGDVDGAGNTVIFEANASGLTFDETTDLGFSTATAKPTSMADCGYGPPVGYDPLVKHICFAPKGLLNAGSLMSDTDFSFTFRVQIQ